MLWKTVADHQDDWHERLPEALWSYRTSVRVSTGVTPFMLVYRTEAILPSEVELSALRMTTVSQLSLEQAEYVASRIASLEAIDEHRHVAGEKLMKYHKAMMRKYNWDIELHKFSLEMLVLCNTHEVRTGLLMSSFFPSLEGPYVVKWDVGKICY